MELDTDSGNIRLVEKWERLETVCHGLWAESSPSAVGVQVLIEEFKEETRRAGRLLVSYRKMLEEQRQVIAKEYTDIVSDKIGGLELQLSRDAERIAALNETLSKKEATIQGLLTQLAAAKAESVDFHDKFLMTASENDEILAKRMAAFHEELVNKAAELEAVWEDRRKTLEIGDKHRVEALNQKQMDLDLAHERFVEEKRIWVMKTEQAEQALFQRGQEMAQLAREHKEQQLEISNFKETLKREIAKVVQHYLAKQRGDNLDFMAPQESPRPSTPNPFPESHE